MEITVLSVAVAVGTLGTTILLNYKKSIESNVAISTKLDMLLVNVNQLNNKVDNYEERLTRVEESTKQAHKRINEMKGENKHD